MRHILGVSKSVGSEVLFAEMKRRRWVNFASVYSYFWIRFVDSPDSARRRKQCQKNDILELYVVLQQNCFQVFILLTFTTKINPCFESGQFQF